MMFLSPLTLFWLLVAGAVVVYGLTQTRSPWAWHTAVGVILLSLLLWGGLYFVVPVTQVIGDGQEVTAVPAWGWYLDAAAWQLSGVLLVLALAVLWLGFPERATADGEEEAARPSAPFVLMVTAAALTAVWADSLVGLLFSWLLVAALWFYYFGINGQLTTFSWMQVGWLVGPLFLGWLTAAAAQSYEGNAWPPLVRTAFLLAVMWQIGAWPFYSWRQLGSTIDPTLAVLLSTFSAVIGLAALMQLGRVYDVGLSHRWLLTTGSLLGILMGLRQAWLALMRPQHLVAALAFVQVNLALLVVGWVEPSLAVAEVRGVLSIGILYLAVGQPLLPWQRLMPLVGVAALTAFPFTAGFSGRAALYNTWLESGYPLLLGVTALLHIPLILAAIWLIQKQVTADAPPTRMSLGDSIMGALLGIGLISVGTLPWGEVRLLTWLAVLVPFGLSVGLARLLRDGQGVPTVLREAFTLNQTLPVAHYGQQLQQVLDGLVSVLREAVLILEGERGLLWLFLFVIIFLLVQ